MSSLQYGCIKGKGTSNAIRDLIAWHQNSPAKHQVAILLDISGAFDNLQWGKLHEDLEKLGCSLPTRLITKSYLKNRSSSIPFCGKRKTVKLTKGCPQGSIFGSVLWNATMNDLLSTGLPEYSRTQAYADDIAVSVVAQTRKQLIESSTRILNVVKILGNNKRTHFLQCPVNSPTNQM